jgi:hypothetical protein
MDISSYISKDGESYYLDVDSMSENERLSGIVFEDGDIIKWFWEEQRMIGKLRTAGYNLFFIENAKPVK